jgi:hypothetical protein
VRVGLGLDPGSVTGVCIGFCRVWLYLFKAGPMALSLGSYRFAVCPAIGCFCSLAVCVLTLCF